MKRLDWIAAGIGVAAQTIGFFEPWPLANADALFAFGVGLTSVYAIRGFAAWTPLRDI